MLLCEEQMIKINYVCRVPVMNRVALAQPNDPCSHVSAPKQLCYFRVI